jgi:hypothetical protein
MPLSLAPITWRRKTNTEETRNSKWMKGAEKNEHDPRNRSDPPVSGEKERLAKESGI